MDFLIYSLEDDKDIALIINKTLTHQGYEIKTFYDAKSFFEAFKTKKPDMVLLDMMLPDMSGSDVLKLIRSDTKNDDIEIIIISANRMIMDKVDGLDLGADDYIEKPFDLLELMSRVSARARRHKKSTNYTYGPLSLDAISHICKYADREVDLTVKEFDILSLLCKKAGNVVTRDELSEVVWGSEEIVESRALDMHIKSIRKKLGDDEIIKTVYGIGYKIKV